jgi:hypothetical protein
MKSFEKYIDAENYAKEVSARDLKPISIVHLFEKRRKDHKKDFVVMDIKDEWYWGIVFVMLITNYETHFEVGYTSPKVGRIVEAFPTKELATNRYKELVKENFRKDIYQRDLTKEQYINEYITPYQRSKAVADEHRMTLINQF